MRSHRFSTALPRLITRLAAACFVLTLALTAAAGRAEDAGFVPLFDGKSLSGWEGKLIF